MPDPGDDDETPRPTDVVLVGSPLPERQRAWPVLRQRENRLEVGEIRAMSEGQPLSPSGEVVRLKPRAEHARLFDVEVLASLAPDAAEPGKNGPPQVATDAYRSGWDTTFGKGDN